MTATAALARMEARWAHHKAHRSPSDTLAPDIAQQVLGQYNLAVNAPPSWLESRGVSTNLIVDSSLGKLVLKRYKPSLDLPQIVYSHSILTRLAEVDFPAPRLVSTRDGSTLVQTRDGTFALFHLVEGYTRYPNTFLPLALARRTVTAAGERMACLHRQLKDFVPEGHNPHAFRSQTEPRTRDLAWYQDELAWCVEETHRLDLVKESSGVVKTVLQRADWLYDRFCELDREIEASAPLRLIIHGDYGPHNLLYKPNLPPLIIDFEDARLDWRIADLARAMRYFSWSGLGVSLNRMKCLLAGYETQIAIADGEVWLIPAIWQFTSIRWLFHCWHRYALTRGKRWLESIRQHLWWMDWTAAHQDQVVEQLVVFRADR